jgi:hypothetical protein
MRWDAAEPENCLIGGESSSPLLRSDFDGVNAGRKQSYNLKAYRVHAAHL